MSLVVTGSSPLTLDQFNTAKTFDARGVLEAHLDIERWVSEFDAGRPYPDRDALRARQTQDDEQERLAVMEELGKIAALRLAKAAVA